MTTPTQPSAAAMAAAEAVRRYFDKPLLWPDLVSDEVAILIDAQFAPVVAALRKAGETLRDVRCHHQENRTYPCEHCEKQINEALAALAAATDSAMNEATL